MTMTIPILTSERLVLRPFSPDDVPRVHELLSTPEIADTTLNIAYPYPEGAAAGWIATHATAAADSTGWTWAITRRSGAELLGAIGLGVVSVHRRGTLGYWLGVAYWGQGFMSEAARAVVAYGFDALHLHRIGAECMSRNPASAKVMQHTGMTYEGTSRGYIFKQGVFEDVDRYAVVRDPAGQR
jgi:RimJ/RimL family protein N-acetyltransferase